jgi:hypothetical protein
MKMRATASKLSIVYNVKNQVPKQNKSDWLSI